MATQKPVDKAAKSPQEKKQEAAVAQSARFKESATLQVNRALVAIEKVGKLSNRKRYMYDVDQAEKVIGALKTAVDTVTKTYEAALTGTVEKQSKFSL